MTTGSYLRWSFPADGALNATQVRFGTTALSGLFAFETAGTIEDPRRARDMSGLPR
jgi:hypothetical protein